ncbi:MAG: MazG family protein, partial [Actinomycetota bacterium]|nr:MazG family protein [Actinomycetota bacterium]
MAVEERLRGPGGCPWDREQSHRSLARYAVEEVYELLEAIEDDDSDAIREELGDVLLQVVFHAQIAQDEGRFTIDDVARGIVDKLVRRHPHVFSDAQVSGADEVIANWDRLKRDEKPRAGVFEGVPAALPALQYAATLLRRAAEAGVRSERGDVGARLDPVAGAEDDDARVRALGLL